MRRRVGLSIVIALAQAGILSGAALAAPSPFEGMRATCPGIGETILTDPGNGRFTPAFIEGTNDLLVPYVVDVTVTGPDGPFQVFGAKAGPVPEDAITCEIDTSIRYDGTTFTFVGTLIVVVVGQP